MREKIKLAYAISLVAHKGQVDKSGKDYINHPLTVASFCENDEEKIVALLHDVVEDTNITLDDLKLFFEDNIIEALNLLTHKSNEDYFEYLKKIKTNPLAKAVKLNDLKHNMDITRFENPSERDYERIEKKYKPAVKFLLED